MISDPAQHALYHDLYLNGTVISDPAHDTYVVVLTRAEALAARKILEAGIAAGSSSGARATDTRREAIRLLAEVVRKLKALAIPGTAIRAAPSPLFLTRDLVPYATATGVFDAPEALSNATGQGPGETANNDNTAGS